MNAAPLLEIRNLAKRFPHARRAASPSPWIIRDLTFSVPDGEFLTIIGPSGAGKSTLLNMIAQVDVATAGDIIFQGDKIGAADPKAMRPGLDRRVGYVTQDDNLLPWRTTIDNVLFPLEVQGRLDDKARAARADADQGGRAQGLRALLSARAVGRHAQARGAHPHARLRPAGHPDGRALRRGRRADAACSSRRICCACGTSGARPSSSSPTTSPRRSCWATAPSCCRASRRGSQAEHPIPIPAAAQRQGFLVAAGLCRALRAHPRGGPMTTVDQATTLVEAQPRSLAQDHRRHRPHRACACCCSSAGSRAPRPSARCSSPIRSTWSSASSRSR